MKQQTHTMPKAVEECHELLAWIIPKLDQFPRHRRFTLGERIETGLLIVLEHLLLSWGRRFVLFLWINALVCSESYAGNQTASPGQPSAALAGSASITETENETTSISLMTQAEATAQLAATCGQADNGEQALAMVSIRPGRFQMGSPSSESGREADEEQHEVTIPRPFAIGRCEITVGQFKQFIRETSYKTTAETDGKGCYVWNIGRTQWQTQIDRNWANPGFAQSDNHPVVCVSWHDAQRYVDWLSQRTGELYRLPTEAEWEYAARAGTVSARFYAVSHQCEYANGAGQEAKSIAGKDWTLADCRDNFIYTAPVASFGENPFGLFDMLGNVWEWTLDCWHDNYQNTPADGSAWLEADGGDCDRRVVRGGSWINDTQYLRSANRSRLYTDFAGNYLGFRVARTL